MEVTGPYVPPQRPSTDAGERRRTLPTQVREKYHRALYALDALGPPANGYRSFLRMAWGNLHIGCNMRVNEEDFATHEAELELQIDAMNGWIDKALLHEKDRERAMWQKQRDFLVGSLRRVRRATTLNDVEHLHFYSGQEPFNADMHHAQFQVAYQLWQGIRTELKEAMNLTMLHDQEHPIVAWIHSAIRRIIWAMEHADVSKLDHYDPNASPLHISQEDQARLLWEAVREEIGATVVAAEGKHSA